MRSYGELKAMCTKMGYKFFDKDLSLNFIWERTSRIYTNKFTDHLHIAYVDNFKEKVLTIPATTKPGLKGSILEPVTVEGITGTAVIVPGQYRSAWKFIDSYTDFSKYPLFRQVGPANYYRDGDRDLELDEVNLQTNKIFGTHWHRMSKDDTYGSGEVNNWSLGCMGSPEPEWKKILPLVRRSVIKYGQLFTGTIVESTAFS
jgi:hypothetical protein